MLKARERKQKYLSKDQEEHHRLLVPRSDSNHWSNSKGYYSKENIPALVTGHPDKKAGRGPEKNRETLEALQPRPRHGPEGVLLQAQVQPAGGSSRGYTGRRYRAGVWMTVPILGNNDVTTGQQRSGQGYVEGL